MMKRLVSILMLGAMLVVLLVGCRRAVEEEKPPPGAIVEPRGMQIEATIQGGQPQPGGGAGAPPVRQPGR